jgi:glycosyltransferase involved in cell wall biosynthesis
VTIGIDAGSLSVTSDRLKTGLYYYSHNLIKNLAKLDQSNKYLLYSYAPISPILLDQYGKNSENRVLGPMKYWMSLRVSLEMLIDPPQVFIGLCQALPYYCVDKSILVVHDLAFERFPGLYPDDFPRLSRQTRRAMNKAEKIIAVSKSTKHDLINFYGIKEGRISVVYHGVDEVFKPRSTKESALSRKKYGISSNYILFVGTNKPVKNISAIINAYKKLPSGFTNKFCLVLA